MLFVKRHGKVGSGFLQLPFLDGVSVAINDGDLADRGQVYKNSWPFFFQLKRLGMRAEFEIAVDALVCRCIEHADRSISVGNINTFRPRIVAELIGIIWILDGVDELVGFGVEDLARSVAFVRDNDSV